MSSIVRLYEAAKDRNLKFSFKCLAAETGPLISRARNLIARKFLDDYPGFTHLLSVDTDVSFSPGDVEALLSTGKPLVGGLYFGRNATGEFFPVALEIDEDTHQRPIKDIPGPKDLVKVDSLGMGFTLIKREVMEALDPDPNALTPYAETVVSGNAVGEDVSFCRAAKDAGYEAWLYGGARVGHVKSVVIGA
jgi:hypothetical protein